MPSRKATPANESKAGNGQLPKGWRMVRFDEIAESINDRVDPAETDLDVYVGLEHLEPESLKIRRWGTPADVKGQKLKFRAGDIIFGKRRAYQRKLAVAECDGICSAHAMVLRAKTDTVDRDFLPFFMQSDLFMNRAVDISVGSLSPTINWKTLRIQLFAIPPLPAQRQVAELLSEIEISFGRWIHVRDSIERVIRTTRFKVFGTNTWVEQPLAACPDTCFDLDFVLGMVYSGLS
jgi:type I restriction enzyme S subunit